MGALTLAGPVLAAGTDRLGTPLSPFGRHCNAWLLPSRLYGPGLPYLVPPCRFSRCPLWAGVLGAPARDSHLERAEATLWSAAVRLSPAAGVHDLLDELAADQVPLATVSNAVFGSRTLAAELERHGLRRSFPCIVSSADVGRRKPDPAPFRMALRRLRVPADRVWHVGVAMCFPCDEL